MKSITFLFFLIFSCGTLNAQNEDFKAPRLVKHAIENTGCYAYFPEDTEIKFNLSYSPDSAQIYVGDFLEGDFHYSMILVKLNGFIESKEDKEVVLESYLDYLKSTYNIVSFAGYGKGHTLESNENAVGMIDYWEDDEGFQWSVKGWADGSFIAIMFIYGATEYPNFNVAQMYLNGVRFE